jgi:hypothetical protein
MEAKRNLTGKPEWKKLLLRQWRKWGDNIKTILKSTTLGCVLDSSGIRIATSGGLM